ncbi:histidine kinase [Streptomyces sp. DG1A-41]|uniref:sensor histidine kinase n=1 Tax=Streptomyces sp. DG1A-41 TaxID=3125779 RepID=UPI0030CDFB90
MPGSPHAGVQRVTVVSRWALAFAVLVSASAFAWPVVAPLTDDIPGLIVFTAYAGLTLAATHTATLALHTPPPGARPALLAVTALATAAGLGLVRPALDHGWLPEAPKVATAACALAVIPTAAAWSCAHWRFSSALALTSTLATGWAAGPEALPGTSAVLTLWVITTLGVRTSQWSLQVMHQLNSARQSETRLAVAEERLRFARDLHDTLGRTLAVIALKAELAARLSPVPRAESELTEIQRLARESQQEIREVVRGYHTTDLETELDGARSVLAAAGITCRVRTTGAEPDPTVQSVLGWAVRETATNVIRHSRASYCAITLTHSAAASTLTVANNNPDPAPATGATAGTGLKGLAQRLADHAGTLTHGPESDGTYLVTARIPAQEHP